VEARTVLLDDHAAVDQEDRASDPLGLVTGEEGGRARDILDGAHGPEP
jgi:hypothetical protein